jgi:hypothetical protein
MGVGLYLQGRYRSPAKKKSQAPAVWLDSVATWFENVAGADDFWGHFLTTCQTGQAHDGQPALFVSIHPAGEDVQFIVPEPGRVIVSTKTSTVGPGYHTALCRLLRWFGEEMKVQWNLLGEGKNNSRDETGYFVRRDRAAVEEEMLLHLRTLAEISVDTLDATGQTLQAWHMPIDHSYSECPGGLRTPLGPRSNEWIRAVLADPRNGRDIYPWWDDGLTAGFFLGRALCELWSKLRWRPALMDEEFDDWDFVCDDLCRAYELDSSLDYPWREWTELIDILNDFEGASSVTSELESVIRERAAQVPAERALIGYRRYPVVVRLSNGWQIRIPGAMAEAWEEGAWSAWDGRRTVWFSHWTLGREDGQPVPAKEVLEVMNLPEGEPIEHRDGGLIGRATLGEVEEDGERLINLKAFSAVEGKAALCNIFYHDEDDFDWAVATWHSLSCPSSSTQEPPVAG